MRRWLILLLVLASISSFAARPAQASHVEFNNVTVNYQFGERLSISAEIDANRSIDQVYLFLQAGSAATQIQPVQMNILGRVHFTQDLSQYSLRPFSRIDYWFRVSLTGGEEVTSPVFSFDYVDNRFDWEILEDDAFVAHWQEGGLEFGQAIINTARAGLERAIEILPAEAPTPLHVYVYHSVTQLQSALQLTGIPWAAGHASPDLGVILVSVPPGPDQQMELERQVPHEIMHLLQYRMAGGAYSRLPFWFAEGLASLVELYPNPDYQRVLDRAVDGETLIPIESLCTGRPNEASNAFQAYAQSASFVRYLHQNFGTIKLIALVEHYKNGLGCAEGVRAAYAISLADLERDWQQEELGVNIHNLVWRRLSPYLLLALFVLIPPLLISMTARRRKDQQKP